MSRTRWLLAGVGGATLTLVAAVAVAAAGSDSGSAADADTAESPLQTAEILRQTLVETEEVTGSLAYSTTTDALAGAGGTVTRLPAVGDIVEVGGVLYRIDQQPTVVLAGSLPTYRPMRAGDEGTDIRQLKRNLDRLGYNDDDRFDVDDDTFDDGTGQAVEEWQEDLGWEVNGVVQPGQVVFTEGDVRIAAHRVEAGTPVNPGQPVVAYGPPEQVVTAELDVADQDMAEVGAEVEIELPTGTAVTGTIDQLISAPPPSGGEEQAADSASAALEVVIELNDIDATKEALGSVEQAQVIVILTAREREDVLTVPVSALLALSEGGYGVEIVEDAADETTDGSDGAGTTVVAVQTGMFADGRVEISGEDIAEGMAVGVPTR